ncbi:hypothetical protein C21_02638 [Arenibacter sp. NBRC 103722]|nr:hypothetical protein C21_02638 [Arenibacter sp. NBRC 103722]
MVLDLVLKKEQSEDSRLCVASQVISAFGMLS